MTTVLNETSNTAVVNGINLDELDDSALQAILTQVKKRAEAKAPLVLAEIAEIKERIENETERLKELTVWCHTNNVRIPRAKADGETDPDPSASGEAKTPSEAATNRGPGRPRKEVKKAS